MKRAVGRLVSNKGLTGAAALDAVSAGRRTLMRYELKMFRQRPKMVPTRNFNMGPWKHIRKKLMKSFTPTDAEYT